MRTRTGIAVLLAIAVAVAVYQQDLAATYTAFGVCWLAYVLHAIEFKLNRLLDREGIIVRDHEIAQD